ncbi:hypothetical protein AB6A40_005458 [Gnathostoma spinigerum]|uniref:Uncharacterized protein n=1 Tax=Gnathostoma spinigerum TaxID=75299 RepID=A0ABD6EFI0_9BILA
MVCLMFHYCSLENLCDRIRPLEGRSVNVFLRCLLTLFDLDCRAAKLFHDIVPKCISINEEEMLKSGSLYVGQCSTLVELAKRLSFNYDDVMLSGMYSSNLADYHTTLRNSCEIISFLCCSGNVEENLLKRSYESLWNVLMRSRHRGVIDHVSECFLRVTDFCLIQKKAVEHPKILLEKTKKLVSMEECETRDLAFSVVINCLAERLSLFQPTFEYMLFLLKNGSFRTAERVLHIIQSILCCARSDVSANYWNTFCLLLDVFRSEAWMVRGRACHCFSALVCRLVGEYTNGYPLFIFISKNRDFWRGFVEIFTAMDMSDPSLILILSFIARIQVIDQNLYSLNEWRTVEKIRQRLLEILLQCRQMRTAHLIINCLFCFGFRITEKYCKALNKKKHSQNLLHFVNYALLRDDRIRCENVLKTGFDREENILFSSKAGRILSEVMELSLPIYRNSLTVQPKFFTLFVSIERLVLSAKELNRLWASHALVLCSEAVLKRLFDLRLRFFCCSCSLLMDEQYNIRRVTSRLLSFMASRQPYSVSPVICIKDLIRKIINDGVEVNELLQFWREWTSSNSIRRRKFNRYFEDSFIEHLILLSSS